MKQEKLISRQCYIRMAKNEKTLVTAAGPNMMPVLEKFSLPTFERFAQEHGYNVEVTQLGDDSLARKDVQAKEARWQKISILKKALGNSALVVWFDADVLIKRFDEDIAANLSEESYQGLVLHDVPAEDRINPNTGVWVMRQCTESFEFLDAVGQVGMVSSRWADQAAVMQVLGWPMGDERHHGTHMPTESNKFFQGTDWLPIGWNQPYCENRPNPEAYVGRPLVEYPNAVHFMAMTIEDRMIYMGRD